MNGSNGADVVYMILTVVSTLAMIIIPIVMWLLIFFAVMIPSLLISVFYIVCRWKIFEKAGEHGWIALIPFYNEYMMSKLFLGNGIWFLLEFASVVPYLGMLVVVFWGVMVRIRMAETFNLDTTKMALLIVVPFVGYPMLAFGKTEEYNPEKAKLF